MKNGCILKNSFDSIVMRHNLMRNEDFETIEQCVNVADNYAVNFVKWVLINKDFLAKEKYTNKELLEIFKQEKWL